MEYGVSYLTRKVSSASQIMPPQLDARRSTIPSYNSPFLQAAGMLLSRRMFFPSFLRLRNSLYGPSRSLLVGGGEVGA